MEIVTWRRKSRKGNGDHHHPAGVRIQQRRQLANQIPLPLPVLLADLSPPRDLERLNRLEERNRWREVADLPIPERDRSPLMPESPLHQEGPPQSIRSGSITPMPSGSAYSGGDDRAASCTATTFNSSGISISPTRITK
jgi:hypothetical protein